MMSLCRTLLGFIDPDGRSRNRPRRRLCRVAPSDAAGLRCVSSEVPSPPARVVESAAVGARTPISKPPPSPRLPRFGEEKHERERPAERIDDGTRGLGYLYGRGGGGRLELCTESLGFESCCDGRMGAEEERAEQEIRRRIEEASRRSPGGQWGDGVARRKARPARRRAERKEFPPPLTWLREDSRGDGGRRRSFLKAVRKDGRLLLKEVQIERPEVLRASRQGGRLRLRLVKPEAEEVEDEEDAVAELEEAAAEVALGLNGGGAVVAEAVMVAEEAGEEAPKQEEEEEEEEEPRWRLPAAKALERTMEAAAGGGGGFRTWRCQELAREGLPSSPFWGSRFMTTA